MFVVYLMSSADNKHVYVGSTKNFKRRCYRHMLNCKLGTHVNHRVQALYNSTGREFFEFDVLSDHTTKAEALEYEQAWVDYYAAHPTVWNLLNIATVNVNCSAHEPEVAAKRLAAVRKPVYVKWADGTEQTFSSSLAAGKHIGVSGSLVGRWIKGKFTTYYKRGIDEIRWA